ncbi:MAG: CAP domain-containing protein [Planctomycetes bacterium]|nr:CAP domain-containing protein [Planctomycetota bacterium]
MKLLSSCALGALTLASLFWHGTAQANPPRGPEAVADPEVSSDIDLTSFEIKPESPQLPSEILVVTRKIGDFEWHTDYTTAYREAEREKKMLFIFFRDDAHPRTANSYESQVLASKELAGDLKKVVRVVLPLSTRRPQRDPSETERTLITHDSFKHMHGREGIAMIDLTDPKSEHQGQVVSAHPFSSGYHTTVHGTKLVLSLPKGSITQRALIFAVRQHPASPLSTASGQCHGYLCKAARDSSQLMASYGSVGHHDWGTRQGDIAARTGRSAMEVAAMSGNPSLLAAAAEIVEQWYGSPSHWGILSTPATFFGFDLVRDGAGNWWGTGIVAN